MIAAEGAERRAFLLVALVVASVVATVLIVYWPALSAGALYMDDKFYLGPVMRNPSWASVKAIFGEVLSPSMVNGYYQPLSLLSILFDFLIAPAGEAIATIHRTTLLLHLLNVVLVICLLRALFGNWLAAAAAGLLYGLHPLNADAVLWIAERKTVLSSCFALLSLLLYVHHARNQARTGRLDGKRYAASFVLYACALLSKPTALPLLALLPLLDAWPLERLGKRAWLEKAPFLLICVLSTVVTIISQSRSGDVGRAELMKPQAFPVVAAFSLGFYVWKLLFPVGLVSDYGPPPSFSLTNPVVLGYALVAIVVAVAIVLSARRTRAWVVGGAFFVIALLPTLGIIRFTWSVTANRSVYLPMVGWLIPLTWHLGRTWQSDRGIDRSAFASARAKAALVLIAVLAAASAVVTRRYEAHWRDSVALLEYYVSEKPEEGTFYTRLGNEWIVRRDYPKAIAAFEQAARFNPFWTENHLNLGRALFTVGRYAEAKPAFAMALRQHPNDWRAHMLMGMTLERLHDLAGALLEFRRASELAPQAAQPHFNIGNVLASQGKMPEAAAEYRQTLRLEPRFTEARVALDQIEAKAP
jgi:Flp pilus assembly protein TadD